MSVLTTTAAPGATDILPAGTWAIDPAHSSLEFAIRHLGIATVKGRATELSGTITGGHVAASEGTVPTQSLTTFDETRDDHLLSPDIFDAERYPELRFASTAVMTTDEEIAVDGELTLKGVTRPVRLVGHLVGPATDPWGNERIGLDLAGSVDRTEFGITWNAPLPGGGALLPDTVVLSASFSAVKAG